MSEDTKVLLGAGIGAFIMYLLVKDKQPNIATIFTSKPEERKDDKVMEVRDRYSYPYLYPYPAYYGGLSTPTNITQTNINNPAGDVSTGTGAGGMFSRGSGVSGTGSEVPPPPTPEPTPLPPAPPVVEASTGTTSFVGSSGMRNYVNVKDNSFFTPRQGNFY
jgi:hypothetical protein